MEVPAFRTNSVLQHLFAKRIQNYNYLFQITDDQIFDWNFIFNVYNMYSISLKVKYNQMFHHHLGGVTNNKTYNGLLVLLWKENLNAIENNHWGKKIFYNLTWLYQSAKPITVCFYTLQFYVGLAFKS